MFGFCSSFSSLCLLQEARAERWILFNPSALEIKSRNLTIHSEFRISREHYVVLDLDFPQSKDNILKNLIRNLRADAIQPDFPIGLAEVNSKGIMYSNHLVFSSGQSAKNIKKPLAWHLNRLSYMDLPSERRGQGVVVAVLDTGVDDTHPQLSPQMWKNQNEIPDNGIDDDKNGFVDDIHGFNFVEGNSETGDMNSHGTHVAGIVGALPFGVGAGIAPEAKIMSVRIIDSLQPSFISDASRAIVYAVDNGAHILCNSWRVYRAGTGHEPSAENLDVLKGALRYARDKGVLFIAAAGNEGLDLDEGNHQAYPASFSGFNNLVVVTSSDRKDRLSSFSNFGRDTVHILAPGEKILSTVPGNRWRQMSGSSMATPIVAGLMARGLSGGTNPNDLLVRLFNTAESSPYLRSFVKHGFVRPLDLLN